MCLDMAKYEHMPRNRVSRMLSVKAAARRMMTNLLKKPGSVLAAVSAIMGIMILDPFI
jgi:hypothetical protein